jgi:hypothetical protein
MGPVTNRVIILVHQTGLMDLVPGPDPDAALSSEPEPDLDLESFKSQIQVQLKIVQQKFRTNFKKLRTNVEK